VIAFSRRDVLMWRDMITEKGLSVATVYGNLSPEVRRAQAERFREGQADIVVGTDALAMGLKRQAPKGFIVGRVAPRL